MLATIYEIKNDLKAGKGVDKLTNPGFLTKLNSIASDYCKGNRTDPILLNEILELANMVWNHNDYSWSPIADGIYDELMNVAIRINPDGYKVGAEDIPTIVFQMKDPKEEWPFEFVPKYQDIGFTFRNTKKKSLSVAERMFPELLINNTSYYDATDFRKASEDQFYMGQMPKRTRSVPHGNPDLVGTITKYRYVMSSNARDDGREDEPNINILERDFFGTFVTNGILDPAVSYLMLLSYKFDGVSMEGRIENGRLVRACTRGDTANDKATDLSALFQGVTYPRAVEDKVCCDIKYEVIITKANLRHLYEETGIEYKNARNGVAGILARTDAPRFRKYLTLVPLQCVYDDCKEIPRDVEVQLNNRYFFMGVPFGYAVIYGNTGSLLFQIKTFVDHLGSIIDTDDEKPFLYDGVVVEFIDPELRKRIGRSNSVNHYMAAIKFEVDQQTSIFIKYRYEVGMNGSITPVGEFQPVKFLGNTINEASCYSLRYFNELDLAPGDMVNVLYVNKVIPRIEKIPNSLYNMINHGAVDPIQFPTTCPVCGSKLVIKGDDAKMAYCDNPYCNGRVMARMASTMKKMLINGAGYATIEKLNATSFRVLYYEVYRRFNDGDTSAMITNLKAELDKLKTNPVMDWWIIGNLGFTNVAQGTFKTILESVSYEHLESLLEDPEKCTECVNLLTGIKGIGRKTAQTIWSEWPTFHLDVKFIMKNFNIVRTAGPDTRPKVVFTGFRDEELSALFDEAGYNADKNNKLTKNTAIVVKADPAYKSSTTETAIQNGITLLTKEEAYTMLKK